jgi:hypothetical protein
MRLRNQDVDLPGLNLAQAIETRLLGHRDDVLPPPSGGEDPADLFVDLAEKDPDWKASLQAAVAALLSNWIGPPTVEVGHRWDDSAKLRALGELCYLAARIGSVDAIDPLRILVEEEGATGLVAPGEDLRLRALRALVGLLGDAPDSVAHKCRHALIAALAEPRLAVSALIGLIGLWPEEANDFLRRLPATAEDADLVKVGVEMAFPNKFAQR